jgi:hypothetical protein
MPSLPPRTRRLAALLLIVAAAAGLALPSAASASASQESIFMDDSELVFGTDQKVEATFSILRSLGVDRVRVSVLWRLLAPDPTSRTRPTFGAGGASDPAAYPAAKWDRYDRIVNAAQRYGIQLLFTVTAPGPIWATSDPGRDEPMLDPNRSDFGAFVTAVGRRYSGTYPDERLTTPPRPGGLVLFPPPPPPSEPPPAMLPRVSMWSIWNEPNQPGWLRPQAQRSGGRTIPASPRVFRGLLDAGYGGLVASGHGGDRILLGETAPRGALRLSGFTPMRPLLFIRELYCLDKRYRPYTGAAATRRACPPNSAGRRRFVADHPGLFRSTGWAHHPYGLEASPSTVDPQPEQVTLAVLPRLTTALDRIFRRYRVNRRLPVWLTEYGYQTNPPDPLIGVSWRRQAAWINEADYLAYRLRRVRSVAQFLLIDDGPNLKVSPSDLRYWGSTFQSGLATYQGVHKPSFDSYQRPIYATPSRVRRGRSVLLYGQLRPARNGAALSATVEFRPVRSRTWKGVRRLSVRSFRNSLVVRIRMVRSGDLRLSWRDPSVGGIQRSRPVAVRVR